MNKLIKRRLIKLLVIASVLTLIVVFVLPPLVFTAYGYVKGDTDWDPTPKSINGITVFEPHYSDHPGHYTFGEKISIASKIDVLALFTGTRISEDKTVFAVEPLAFPKASPIGQAAPDFELETTGGATVRLSDKRGKIGVFMFVAMTCPPARMQVDFWTELNKKYDQHAVEMFFVYSVEQHAGERGYREFEITTTYEQKMDHARMMSELTDVPIVVDGMDEIVLATYGMTPNAAFVVNEDGVLVFKSQWADVHKIEKVIDLLLEEKKLSLEFEPGTTAATL